MARAQPPTRICTAPDWTVDKFRGQIRIFHQRDGQFPQYGALHLKDGYFRLNYGPGSGWGTSVVLPPSFWSGGRLHQGARVDVSCRVVDTLLELTVTGQLKTLAVTIIVLLSHPTRTAIRASVRASLTGTVKLDARPAEAFKPVMLSSMHISSTEWDAKQVCVGATCFALPQQGWLSPSTPTLRSTRFQLTGGTSSWKTNAPTLAISQLNSAQRITGWVTPSQNHNHDNVGVWAATHKVLPAWSYVITASQPSYETAVWRHRPTE